MSVNVRYGERRSGVLPDIDGTWAAICPTCLTVVVNLEQNRDRVAERLETHRRERHGLAVTP